MGHPALSKPVQPAYTAGGGQAVVLQTGKAPGVAALAWSGAGTPLEAEASVADVAGAGAGVLAVVGAGGAPASPS